MPSSCFFCLQDCDSDCEEGSHFPLRNISRFLQSFQSNNARGKRFFSKENTVVQTCEDCSEITSEFTELYQILEVTKLRLNWSIQKMHHVMSKAGRRSRLRKKTEIDDGGGGINKNPETLLRRDVMGLMKAVASPPFPLLVLHRIQGRPRLRPQEMEEIETESGECENDLDLSSPSPSDSASMDSDSCSDWGEEDEDDVDLRKKKAKRIKAAVAFRRTRLRPRPKTEEDRRQLRPRLRSQVKKNERESGDNDDLSPSSPGSTSMTSRQDSDVDPEGTKEEENQDDDLKKKMERRKLDGDSNDNIVAEREGQAQETPPKVAMEETVKAARQPQSRRKRKVKKYETDSDESNLSLPSSDGASIVSGADSDSDDGIKKKKINRRKLDGDVNITALVEGTATPPPAKLTCPSCRGRFKERNDLEKHMVQYHCEHFFPGHKLESVTDSQFKIILSEMLFQDLFDDEDTTCSFCWKPFNAPQRDAQTMARYKLHYVQEHFEELQDILFRIQEDPNLSEIIDEINPDGKFCECGVYLSNYVHQQTNHDKLHCVNKKSQDSGDEGEETDFMKNFDCIAEEDKKDQVICKLCKKTVYRNGAYVHFHFFCNKNSGEDSDIEILES